MGETGSVARSGGLKKMVTENLGEIDARGINSIPLFVDDDDRDVVVRVGRYGPYLQRTPARRSRTHRRTGATPGDRVSLPEGIAPDELTPEKVDEFFLGGGGERKLGEHPETGEPIVVKSGRYGPYVSSGERNSSLLSTMAPDSVSLDDALKLLSLPRVGRQGRRGRRDHRVRWPLRPVHQARRRHPVARERGPAVHGHARGGAGAAGRAEAAWPRGGQAAAA